VTYAADCVCYTAIVPSMKNAMDVINLIKEKIGKNGQLLELINRMDTKYKLVFDRYFEALSILGNLLFTRQD